MVAESEQFDHPGDILIHKHELLLFSWAINSTSRQYVQYAICLYTHTHTTCTVIKAQDKMFLHKRYQFERWKIQQKTDSQTSFNGFFPL